MVECQNIEWKESWNEDLLKWICGFANAQGGKLYIGISDDGSVCGVPKIKKVLEDIPNKVRDVLGIMVDINALKRDDKDIIEIVVNPSSYPINCRGANVPHSDHKNVPHSAAIKLDGVKGKIYNYILANPNVSINSISKHLDLCIDMISGCLSEMREYVVCEGQGEDAIFRIVPANVPINVPHSVLQNVPANIPHSAAIKLDGIKGEIYRCILANPNVSRMSIAKQLGVSVKTIGRHLSEMKKYVIYDGRGSRSSWKII